MTLHAPILPPDAGAILAGALPVMGPLPQDALCLAAMGHDAQLCAVAVAEELRQEPGLDAKGCGAYLVNRLGWSLGRALAAMDLSGRDMTSLDPAGIGFVTELKQDIHEGQPYVYLDTKVTVSPCHDGATLPAPELARLYEMLFTPMIAGVSAACTLGPGALWRLVTDGIALGYLSIGQDCGRQQPAIARAEAILKQPGTRLYARQLNFLEVTLTPDESPTGAAISDTFRERAGCCRYYTTARSEGTYCSTCIHRKDRAERLRLALLHRARLAAGLSGLV